MEKFVERRKTNRFDNVAQQVYIYTFYGVCAYIVVLTGLIVWQSNDPDNDLLALVKTILEFVEKMVAIYVLPIAFIIVKEALPHMAEILRAWRSIPNAPNNTNYSSTGLSATQGSSPEPPVVVKDQGE